jgi:hypothetical protein
MVIVVSSIAGGSGAGMFIDVAEAVKSAAGGQPWADRIFGVLYAPDVFAEINNMDAIAPNALAAISETMSGYWNNNPTESTTATRVKVFLLLIRLNIAWDQLSTTSLEEKMA